MIEMRLDDMLAKRGRTAYWLAKETGIQHAQLWRIRAGRSGAIKYDTLEKMCRALDCQPGDLLVLIDDRPEGKRKSKAKAER
jgi:putative transcriptional regulator